MATTYQWQVFEHSGSGIMVVNLGSEYDRPAVGNVTNSNVTGNSAVTVTSFTTAGQISFDEGGQSASSLYNVTAFSFTDSASRNWTFTRGALQNSSGSTRNYTYTYSSPTSTVIEITAEGSNYSVGTPTVTTVIDSTSTLNTEIPFYRGMWDFQVDSPGTTSYSFDPDINNSVYSGSVSRTSLPINTGADGALSIIGNSIVALHSNITWDGSITTSGSQRRIEIDLGTTTNIEASLQLNANSGRNTMATTIAMNASNIPGTGTHSTYSLIDPGGNAVTSFTSSVSSTSASDLDFVIAQLVLAINDATPEMPEDFVAEDERNNSRIVLTALQSGALAGLFVATVSANGQTTNAGNITLGPAAVISAGQDETVTDLHYASGKVTTNNHIQPVATLTPVPNNLVATRVVSWQMTEPAVSTNQADYPFRDLIPARSPGRWIIPVSTLPGSSIAVEGEFLGATFTPATSVTNDMAVFYTGAVGSPSSTSYWLKVGETVWSQTTNI